MVLLTLKNILFKTTNVIEGFHAISATRTNWELSPYVETQRPYTRNKLAMLNIENHLSASSEACVGSSVKGMRNSSSKRGGHI